MRKANVTLLRSVMSARRVLNATCHGPRRSRCSKSTSTATVLIENVATACVVDFKLQFTSASEWNDSAIDSANVGIAPLLFSLNKSDNRNR